MIQLIIWELNADAEANDEPIDPLESFLMVVHNLHPSKSEGVIFWTEHDKVIESYS